MLKMSTNFGLYTDLTQYWSTHLLCLLKCLRNHKTLQDGFYSRYYKQDEIYTPPSLSTYRGDISIGRFSNLISSVHDKFHRILVLSGFFFLKIASTFLNSSFFPKPIKRRIAI